MATKKDFTQIAFAVVQQATGEAPKPVKTAKQMAGAKGGLKGGKARMDKLTEAERHELAMKGVAAKKRAPAKRAGAEVTKT
jgi:hypothetical protein